MIINNLKEIILHSTAIIKDDCTELWVITNKICNENPQLSFSQLIEVTKLVIYDLVENYDVHLMDEETQKPLKLSSKEIVDIVENRLKKLNRMPNIGDGIWFTI